MSEEQVLTIKEIAQIFDNEDFGYRRIIIERLVKLSFQASAQRIEQLQEAKAFQNVASSKKKGAARDKEIAAGRELQQAILAAIGRLDQERVYKNRELFEEELNCVLKGAGLSVPGPVKKTILAALSERDDTADICIDKKGEPPDSELRDYENVPLKEDIAAYFEREVKPHVPDAWIAGVEIRGSKAVVVDESKVSVGYEIPVTRHFYKYKPSSARGDRGRDSPARGRDPGTARRGAGVSTRLFKYGEIDTIGEVCA